MKKLLLFGFLFSVFISGCNTNQPPGDKVQIENKLHKNIVCILGYNYPDLKLNFTSKQAILANDSRFEIEAGKTNEIDTLGLCNKKVWDGHIKHNMLMLFVFDKDKLTNAESLEDALTERYYFSYIQLIKTKGVITIQ